MAKSKSKKNTDKVSGRAIIAFIVTLLICGSVSTFVLLNIHYLRRLAEDNAFYTSGMRVLEIWVVVFVSFSISIFMTVIAQKNRDIKKLSDKLATVSISDHLTGVYNSQYFMVATANQLNRISRSQDSEAFIIAFEINDFKEINQTHGRQSGNAVLREVASRITEKLRPYDILARFRGERFMVFVSDIKYDNIIPLTQRVSDLITRKAITIDNEEVLFVAAKFGIAAARSVDDLDAAIALAENGLAEAKASESDTIVFMEEPKDEDSDSDE
jgi:diguanylate cyclase (GGDEF)-like protein